MARTKRTLIKLTNGLAQAVRMGKTIDQPTFPKWKGRDPERLGRASGKANPSVKSCRFEEKKRPGCAVELDFLSRRDADKLGTEEGPVLRFCEAPKGKAYHVPVKSPQDAAKKATAYCECVGENKAKRGSAECLVKVRDA